jgi:hypothetical protein
VRGGVHAHYAELSVIITLTMLSCHYSLCRGLRRGAGGGSRAAPPRARAAPRFAVVVGPSVAETMDATRPHDAFGDHLPPSSKRLECPSKRPDDEARSPPSAASRDGVLERCFITFSV